MTQTTNTNGLTNADYRKNSFEPRIAVVQLVFGIIYSFVTGVGIILIFKVLEAGEKPYMQIFFAILFGILALKSF